MTQAHFPTRIVAQETVEPCGGVLMPRVGEVRPTWEQVYAEDLKRLQRIEDQNYCFFDEMGEFAAERLSR